MMMNLQFLKTNSEEDLKKVEVLAREIWLDHFTPIIGIDQVEFMLEKYNSVEGLKYHIDNKGYEVRRVIFEDRFIGYLAFTFQEEKLFLSKFYLHKSVRGKGLGRACFKYLIDRAEAQEVSIIKLTVNKYNDGTIAAYKKMGFVTIDSVVTDIGNGFVMDDFVMEYVLK